MTPRVSPLVRHNTDLISSLTIPPSLVCFPVTSKEILVTILREKQRTQEAKKGGKDRSLSLPREQHGRFVGVLQYSYRYRIPTLPRSTLCISAPRPRMHDVHVDALEMRKLVFVYPSLGFFWGWEETRETSMGIPPHLRRIPP